MQLVERIAQLLQTYVGFFYLVDQIFGGNARNGFFTAEPFDVTDLDGQRTKNAAGRCPDRRLDALDQFGNALLYVIGIEIQQAESNPDERTEDTQSSEKSGSLGGS